MPTVRGAGVGGWVLVAAVAGCAAPRQLWFGGDVYLGNGGAERLKQVADALAPARGVVNLEGPIGTQAEAAASESSAVGAARDEADARAGTEHPPLAALGPSVGTEATAVKLVNGPGAAAALAAVGIAAAGVENNHAGDLGEAGRSHTRAVLTSASVDPIGPTHLELAGLRVVLTAHDLTRGAPSHLAEQLRAARETADVLVATFHVTGPPSLLPPPELKEAVELALAAGAKVVVAHGSHALGLVERRGEAVIAWGLGNLAFACACTDEVDGLALTVEFDARGRVTRAAAVPVTAGLRGAAAKLSATPKLVLDVLEALGAKPTRRLDDRSEF